MSIRTGSLLAPMFPPRLITCALQAQGDAERYSASQVARVAAISLVPPSATNPDPGLADS